MQLFATYRVFLPKITTYRYSSLMLFIDAKSTLRTAEVQCKREFYVFHTFRLSGTVCISTEDPGEILRDLWGVYEIYVIFAFLCESHLKSSWKL